MLEREHTIKPDANEDFEWLSQHPEEVAKHSGEWIAVKKGIVASGKILKEVVTSVDAQGISAPLILRVPESDIEYFVFESSH